MAKNKMTDYNDHLFVALERLNDEDLKPEQLEMEAKRVEAIIAIGDQIIEVAKVTVDALRVATNANLMPHELPDHFGFKKQLVDGN